MENSDLNFKNNLIKLLDDIGEYQKEYENHKISKEERLLIEDLLDRIGTEISLFKDQNSIANPKMIDLVLFTYLMAISCNGDF